MEPNIYRCQSCGNVFEEGCEPNITLYYTKSGYAYSKLPQIVLCDICTEKFLQSLDNKTQKELRG